MDKRQEELLEAIRFLLVEFELPTIESAQVDELDSINPQLVGCMICFYGTTVPEVYKYNTESEFEPYSNEDYTEFI